LPRFELKAIAFLEKDKRMAMQQTRSPEIVPGPFHLPKSGKRFLAHFMIRGTNRGAETAAIAECRDMFEVVSRGAEKFPAFHLRNPWIFGDSIQGRAFVLLDPESATLDRDPTPQRGGTRA